MKSDLPFRKSAGLALDPADLVWLQGLARALLRDVGRADDLVQDTVVAALRSHPEEIESKRGWLRTVAQRIALRQQRDETRRRDHEHLVARKGTAPSSAALVAAAEAAEKVALVARGLDEPFRQTVLERFLEGASVQEISERSGVKSDTIRWRLRRGLELMRLELAQLQPDGELGDHLEGQWALLLVPLAALPGGATTLSSAGAAASIPTAIMSIKTLVLAAAALIVAGIFWIQATPPVLIDGIEGVAPEEVALPMEAAAAPTDFERVAIEQSPALAQAPAVAVATTIEEVQLRGRVVDDRGKGVEGATVHLVEPNEDDAQRALANPRTTTDRSGRFTLLNLGAWFKRRPDEVHLYANANGYLRSEAIPVTGPQDSDRLEVLLIRGRSVEGRVVDAGGQPIAGLPLWIHSPFVGDDSVSISRVLASAAVRNLYPPEGWPHQQCEDTTRPDGSVTFTGLDSGDYVVRSLDPSWEILEPRVARGGDFGVEWVATTRFSVQLVPQVRGGKRKSTELTPLIDMPRLRADFRVELVLNGGTTVDTGQWHGWGNGGVTFTLTQELVPDIDLSQVVRARFYGTATLNSEEAKWRSALLRRDRLGQKSTRDVIVKFKGKPTSKNLRIGDELAKSDQEATRNATVELDVRYRESGAPFSGQLSIEWARSLEKGQTRAGSYGASRGKRLPSGRYEVRVPAGDITFELKDAHASGSLPSWTGETKAQRSRKTVVFAELDQGAVVDVLRPKEWRGEWFVRASYRENSEDPWFGSWNYSTPTKSLRLSSLKPAEWRFQLRRSSSGPYEETRTAVLVPGDSIQVE